MQQLTPELVAAVLAGFLSLAFTYIPGLNSWFASLAEDMKKALMGALTILTAFVIYILACTPSLGFPYVSCPTGGIWELLGIILVALGVNQGVDRISPEPKRVKVAKVAAKAAASK